VRSPNTALQRTRSAPLRSPLSLKPLGDQMREPRRQVIAGLVFAVYGLPILRLSEEDRRRFLEDDFSIVTSTAGIPLPVLRRFVEITKTQGVAFAEPRAKYQETDIVDAPRLPHRRLFFAGVSKQLCFIHYEMGGLGHGEYLVVFRVGGRPELIWKAAWDRPTRTLKQLRDDLRAGRFRDQAAYFF
jgi:hypothetical protein